MIKFHPDSLRLKLIAYVFTSSVFIILLLGTVVFFQTDTLIHKMEREDLLEQARKIASYIEYDWKDQFALDLPKRYRKYYNEPNSNHQFAVTNPGGRFLFKSDNFMQEQIKPTLDKGGEYYFSFTTEDGEDFTGLKYDYLFDGKIYPIFVIENKEVFSRFLTKLEKDFISNLLLYGSPLLLLQGLFIVLIMKHALTPVLQVSRDARNIKYDNLSFRLNEKNIPREILPLIQSVNNSLSRLEQSAEAQKFFIANAAHELRTPISILKARIASLQNEREIFSLNEDLRSINRLISQLLDISRLDLAEAAPMQEVNLNEIAKKACEDMGALFITEDKELSLEQKEYDQIILGNEDTLLRAFLNLLENALKHTPDKTPVQMIIEDKKVTVRDYGTPIPDEHKDRIFERFEKNPDSMSAKGSGLGLAIVKKAAEIHEGSVYVTPRQDGNDFVLDFTGK